MYHGRILDYLRGVGLEQNAVVMVHQPDQGNAWVNVSYAGFVGSVTAMNEKHIAIGEMGGRGEGQLGRQTHGPAGARGHGKGQHARGGRRDHAQRPAHLRILLRHLRRQDRSSAVGIAATPTTFEIVRPGAGASAAAARRSRTRC